MAKISAADGPTNELLPGYYDLGTVTGDARDADGVPVHSPDVTVNEDGDKLVRDEDGNESVETATDEERGLVEPEDQGEAADLPAEDEYDGMTNDQLRAELEERELPTSGNKSELVARLREDDAS